MKKLLLVFVITMGFAHEVRAMTYVEFGLRLMLIACNKDIQDDFKHYVWGEKKLDKFPDHIDALYGLTDSRSEIFPGDACEFIEPTMRKEYVKDGECSYQLHDHLRNRCVAIHEGKANNHFKDIALYKFLKVSSIDQNERDSWCIDPTKKNNRYRRDSFFWSTININGKDRQIRRDEKSPYFKMVSPYNLDVMQSNLIENEAFHDELQFLRTQLHTMDLYWEIKPDSEKEGGRENFDKTRALVENEIALLKTKRMEFAHSCLKPQAFEALQLERNDYTEKAWSNLSWLQKKINPINREQFDQDVAKFKVFQQQHEDARQRREDKKLEERIRNLNIS